MGLGWHSAIDKGGFSSDQSSTDPALLDALALIAQRIQELTVVMEGQCIVGIDCPEDTAPTEGAIVDEQGAYLVTELGDYVVYEVPAQLTNDSGALVVDEQGQVLVAEA